MEFLRNHFGVLLSIGSKSNQFIATIFSKFGPCCFAKANQGSVLSETRNPRKRVPKDRKSFIVVLRIIELE